jgi:hypothetical protein
MKLGDSRQIFEKNPKIKFYKNPRKVNRVVPRRLTGGQGDRKTDMTKLIAAFGNFANAANKKRPLHCSMKWINSLMLRAFLHP